MILLVQMLLVDQQRDGDGEHDLAVTENAVKIIVFFSASRNSGSLKMRS